MASSKKYEVKTFKNASQNSKQIQKAVDEGFEVYERNERYVRLRRELSEEDLESYSGTVFTE